MAGGYIIIGASAYFMIYFVHNKPNSADITPEDQTEVFVVVEEVTVVCGTKRYFPSVLD